MRGRCPAGRVAAVFLALALSLSGASWVAPSLALADEVAYSAAEPPALASPAAYLVDEDTGTVLLEKDADVARPPASVTKVMTALVVLENADLDAQVTVEEGDFEHVTRESTVAGLRAGETLTVKDLLAGLLLPSGNDAAYVLARAVGGDWQTFVGMMNEKAASLGCASTHFSDPCGLTSENHYTTARDLATMFEAALAYPAFVEIAGSATWDLPATSENPARTLENTNELIDPESPSYLPDTIVAGKTGFTYAAGRCLIVAAERDGMRLVGVVLGAPNEEDEEGVWAHFADVRSMLEWGFGAWTTGEVVTVGSALASADVELSSTGDEVDALATEAITATVPRGTTLDDLTVTPSWDGSFQAPVEEGQALGEATVALGDRILGTVGVAAAQTMELSLVDYAIWWLSSDPTHAAIAASAFAAVMVVVGLVAGISSRRRRRERERYRVPSGVPVVVPSSGVGRANLVSPAKGGTHDAPKHAAPKHAASKQSSPKQAEPKGSAPKHAAPKHAAPKKDSSRDGRG